MSQINKSSGLKAASALIVTGKAIVDSIDVITNGAADATVILYDNTAGSGTELGKFVVPAASLGATFSIRSTKADTGVYAVLTGTGAGYVVRYR